MAQTIGSKFKSARADSGVTQLVAPSENTNGITLCTAGITIPANLAWLNTGPVAPPNHFGMTTPAILVSGAGGATLPYPVVIPAGQGVWLSSYSTGFASITYEPIV
ncbi:hypothetical protein ACDZ94_20170 [Pseudomonas sp. UBT]|uniref:hypothetical protein n=1 Tax=Pseudomonas sp. UBT TaxID=3239198 RepID=UPI003D805E22